ncbi:hypothetical protein Hanom_Chr11g00992601 [Helianthus anomalus]
MWVGRNPRERKKKEGGGFRERERDEKKVYLNGESWRRLLEAGGRCYKTLGFFLLVGTAVI